MIKSLFAAAALSVSLASYAIAREAAPAAAPPGGETDDMHHHHHHHHHHMSHEMAPVPEAPHS
jgi:hypothetical protein